MSEVKEGSASERADTRPGAGRIQVPRLDTIADTDVTSVRRATSGEVLGGKYRIVSALGDGGMGQVFAAENLTIGRQVALKVLRSELLASEDFRKRFQKEAEAIAAIDHPNVVGFLDLVIGDPTFLVMEYVAGPTLAATLLAEGRLSYLRAAELARRLCWGLDAAHRAGVIHRDVKPSNIILAPDGEFGEQPKLIDFGVAKTAPKPADLQLTRHGQIIGTPHYMSPEQISGVDVDARSDVYALGCVLYHMAAGRPPFVGLEEYQILRQHAEHEAPPASTFAPDIPPELDQVLKRALAKQPSARFETMRDMARALADISQARGAARSETSTRTLRVRRSPPDRGPASLLALAAIAVVAAALGAIATWLSVGRTTAFSSGLLIVSEPAGARVELDGNARAETTPTAIAGLPPGAHVIKLVHEGYGDVERTVQLSAHARELVDVALPPASHRVSVTSAPAAATVFLDGKLVPGTTPTFMTVTDDDFHEVRVERAGYEPLVYPLKPEDRQPELALTLEPEREPRGTVTVDSNGVAQVWIDGVYSGYDTPTLGIHVRAGDHVIELRDSSIARSAPAKIHLQQGESLHLTISMKGAGER